MPIINPDLRAANEGIMGELRFRRVLPWFLLLLLGSSAYSYDWTHSVEIARDTANDRPYRAYLWIPETCTQGIRGLIMTTHTSCEALFVVDSNTRSAARDERLAIIYFYPSQFGILNASDTTRFLRVLDTLADVSGFPEISHAPWMALGHSTSCNFVMALAWWKPERTFAAMPYKGGIVGRPSWTTNDIYHIPLLAFNGEFEEYAPPEGSFQRLRSDALGYRRSSPTSHLVGAAMCTGEGHMAWSKRAAPLVASFIRKAATKRIGNAPIARDGPVRLYDMPAQEGWLADTNVFGAKGNVAIDTFTNPAISIGRLWMIDREFAEAWRTFHLEVAKTRQSVKGTRPTLEPSVSISTSIGSTQQFVNWKVTLDMSKSYKITVPSSSGLPVSVFAQTGPGYIDENGLLRFNPCKIPEETTTRVVLRQDGNDQYTPADCLLRCSVRLATGDSQVVNIPENIPVLTVGDSWSIGATLSSGLPVRLWVLSGPGELDSGDRLTAKPFPMGRSTAQIWIRAGQEGGNGYATAKTREFAVRVNQGTNRTRRQALGGINPSPGVQIVSYRAGVLIMRGTLASGLTCKIEVLSADGRAVRELTTMSDGRKVGIGSIAPGSYILRVTVPTKGGMSTSTEVSRIAVLE